MTVRVGINGFGRIGRNFLRAAVGSSNIEIVALNDLVSAETNAHLLRYDSTLGRYPGKVSVGHDTLLVDGHEIAVMAERDPADLAWGALGVDVVLESTGRFTKREKAAAHLSDGAQRVVISAPADDADATFVVGVNDDTFDPQLHYVVSNASCTTNCFAPMVKVLDDSFGVRKGLMTTVHAYTNDQELLDLARDDLRRSRAAAVNIVPTSTGAARATSLVMQSMKGRLDGRALRVPVQDGSITDFTAIVNGVVDVDEINRAYSNAAATGSLARVLEYSDEPLVSSDILGTPASVTLDAGLTMAMPLDDESTLVKVFGWYDNEWGYSNRLVDLIGIIGAVSLAIPVLEDLGPLKNKRVLLRVDFNVPLAKSEDGTIVVGDDFRIRATLPTIEWLLDQGADVVACTHLGRPEGKVDERYSVAPLRAVLAELAPGVELLENLRFDPGEEANSTEFVDKLVQGFDYYVNDAFGASHRRHGSIVGPPTRLPSAGGRLLAREVEVIEALFENPPRPFVAIVGGAKVRDKLAVLRALASRVDALVIGGAMSYTFLKAQGADIGDSLLDREHLKDCEELLASGLSIVLPTDSVVTDAERNEVQVIEGDIPAGWSGVDIGPTSAKAFAEVIRGAGSALWNGPMGIFEDPRFSAGTRAVADAMASCSGFTVVGGGDSAAAIDEFGLAEQIDHVSTGGGATLELIENGDLPGLQSLRDAASEQSA